MRFSFPLAKSKAVRPFGARARFAAAAASLLLAFALLAGCGVKKGAQGGATSSTAAGGKGEIGTAAPRYALRDLTGATVSSDAFAGKVVILDFWATWCPPCREEIPHLVKLQAKYREQGLAIVGLSLDAGGAKDVAPFADEHDINYTMLLANDEVAKAYGGITYIPTTFVIGRDGTIVKRFVGYTAPEAFEAAIAPLLAPAS